jgi:hypothetical protein
VDTKVGIKGPTWSIRLIHELESLYQQATVVSCVGIMQFAF